MPAGNGSSPATQVDIEEATDCLQGEIDGDIESLFAELAKADDRTARMMDSLSKQIRENTDRIMRALEGYFGIVESTHRIIAIHGQVLAQHEKMLGDHDKRLARVESKS